jgi:UDP-N-acetylglucosamine 2-epimerase (non-hydrolysing)
MNQLHLIDPVGYLDLLKLMSPPALVLTDSGGIQEETTISGVSRLALRENSERPVTLTQGTNQLVGHDPNRILNACRAVRAGTVRLHGRPEKWDGRASSHIARLLPRRFPGGQRSQSNTFFSLLWASAQQPT